MTADELNQFLMHKSRLDRKKNGYTNYTRNVIVFLPHSLTVYPAPARTKVK